jgi:hypothetical protein
VPEPRAPEASEAPGTSPGGLDDARLELALLLRAIERYDTDYDVRYGFVIEALAVAQRLGYPAGVRFDPQEPAWPVAVIELPRRGGAPGQVSWHLPQHQVAYDGHTTAEKYDRCRAFCAWAEAGGEVSDA